MIITVIASILSAILYRLGGAKGYNTKFRDLGVPLVITMQMWLLTGWSWTYIPAFLMLFGALTTYWDSVFGHDNFWFHGFMCALAIAPIIFITGHIWLFVIRALFMAVFMGLWCFIFSNDNVEECGRGAIIAATIPMVL